MNRRTMLTSPGATTLGMSLLLGGGAGTLAQDAGTPATSRKATASPHADFAAGRAQAYDDFVAALASELGTDEAAVDTAIRAALTQAVDARLAAGEIDAERAAAAKAVIDDSDAPLMAGFGGLGARDGFEDRGRRSHGHRDGHREKGKRRSRNHASPQAGDTTAPATLMPDTAAPGAGSDSLTA